ncbi:hypothetical protein HYG86_12245 [Alkalicella caledoniensis]|uniref:Cardiolipin synthase N-terminal domain-containing protein n=1 Tax=Alkalicella caledoniensis TaxID=2731377 RepID=A0A7G9W9X0_ALKCA|nr:hypothetical protein [Alkalicella caledoniensis]QNO15482.1 hypothetical protein HYG86_12245 [Alkalicella caledoniensis]
MSDSFYGSERHGIILLVQLIIAILYAIIVPIWAYIDAEKRGKDDPGTAAAIVFFGGPLGLIYWLSVRPPK